MLRIDNKRIIPAPFVNFTKNYVVLGDGRILSTQYVFNINGTLLPTKGSPYSTGVFYTGAGYPSDEVISTVDGKFNAILRKQEALKEVLAIPGSLFEFGPDDGSPSVSGRIKTGSINYEPGTWVDLCRYSATIETEEFNKSPTATDDNFGIFDNYFLSQAQENIEISQSEDGLPTLGISHNISAVGKVSYTGIGVLRNNKEPWENACDWCQTRLNDTFITAFVNTSGKTKYNKRSTESIDKFGGSYSINSTYTLVTGVLPYIHNYDINTTTTRSQIDDLNSGQSLQSNITINGTIQGFSANGISQSGRLDIARSGFNIDIQPNLVYIAGLASGHLFVSQSVGENTANGTLTYSVNYNTFPLSSIYTHTFNVNDSRSSNNVNQASVNGSIKYNLVSGSIAGGFTALTGIWNSVKGTLRSLVSNCVGYNVIGEPINATINYSRPNLQIDYSAVYNQIDADHDTSANYVDQYEVSITDQNNSFVPTLSKKANVSINGTIIGLSLDGNNYDRYANALSRWNTVKPLLRNRCTGIIGSTGVSVKVLSRNEGYNKTNGSISYSYTFSANNSIATGIITEDIVVDTSYPKDIYAIQIIPGITGGPIIQNLTARSEARRTVTVNFALDEGVPITYGDARFNAISNTFLPAGTSYIENNNSNYNVYNNTYVRTKTWVYKE